MAWPLDVLLWMAGNFTTNQSQTQRLYFFGKQYSRTSIVTALEDKKDLVHFTSRSIILKELPTI
jgi:hypothetical protein